MPVVILDDQIQGARVQDSVDGRTMIRQIIVAGLPPTPKEDLLKRALTARMINPDDSVLKSVPTVGSVHESAYLKTFYVESVNITNWNLATNKVHIEVGYRDLSFIRIVFNGQTVRDTTKFDSDGAILDVRFDPTITGGARPHAYPSSGGRPFFAETPVLIPKSVLEFEFYDVGTWANTYESFYPGMINSENWQLGNPHEWLCTSYGGGPWDSLGRVAIYRRKATFELCGSVNGIQETWDPIIMWKAPSQPVPPYHINPKLDGFTGYAANNGTKVQSGNGWRHVQVQGEADFEALKLPDAWDVRTPKIRDGT